MAETVIDEEVDGESGSRQTAERRADGSVTIRSYYRSGGAWRLDPEAGSTLSPAAWARLMDLLAPSAALADRLATVEGLLAAVVEHYKFAGAGNAPGHAHLVPGVWDKSNGPPDGGKPCEWCATWRKVLAATGR